MALSGADRERKFKSETMISAKLATQIVAFVFSVVVVLSLIAGGALFGAAGRAINKFILGTLGHSAYPLFIATIYFTVKLFANKKFTARRKPVACAGVLFISAVLCYHLMTSTAMLKEAALRQYLRRALTRAAAAYLPPRAGEWCSVWSSTPSGRFDVVGSYIIYCLIFR